MEFKVGDIVKISPDSINDNYYCKHYSDQLGQIVKIDDDNDVPYYVQWNDGNAAWYTSSQLQLCHKLSNIKEYDMEFKAGQPVLVRDDCEYPKWEYALFSYKDNEPSCYPYHASGSMWSECIPFEGNESFLGTDKKYEPPHKFKRGNIVYYRDSDEQDWTIGVFAEYSNSPNYPFQVFHRQDKCDPNAKPSWVYCKQCKPFKVEE